MAEAPTPTGQDRPGWLALLARATPEELDSTWDALPRVPAYTVLQAPTVGLVMVRGRAGGEGRPFNLGETTVTRATVRIDRDVVGHGYVLGRRRRCAERIAVFDALLQTGDRNGLLGDILLDPVRKRTQRERARRRRRAAATRVDFFTMAREAS